MLNFGGVFSPDQKKMGLACVLTLHGQRPFRLEQEQINKKNTNLNLPRNDGEIHMGVSKNRGETPKVDAL